MQLWRCLAGMKRKSSDGNGLDLIPYRESKLTHLLMPELGRAGLSGVAMITCVNPQVDDYDETISVLSNASIACKITEIVEVGRPVTAPVLANHRQSVLTSIITNTTSTDIKQQQQVLKRKRENQTSNSRESTMTTSSNNQTGPIRSITATTQSISKTSISSTTVITGNPIHNINDEPEVKRLRTEINHLQEENQLLKSNQFQREFEIREEICDTMATRSNRLLEQIQDLQNQLRENDVESKSNIILKSSKKAKRKHYEDLADETMITLNDQQEEYELIKTKYEKEISDLKDDKISLILELQEWKNRSEITMKSLETLQQVVTNDLSPNTKHNLIQSTKNSIENDTIFMKRMQQRDNISKPSTTTAATTSPKRSPLNNITKTIGNKINSPNAVIFHDNQVQLPKNTFSPTRNTSPNRSLSPTNKSSIMKINYPVNEISSNTATNNENSFRKQLEVSNASNVKEVSVKKTLAPAEAKIMGRILNSRLFPRNKV